MVFEPLLRWQPQGAVKPSLFNHWTHSEDGRTWHFHIRDDATFHDGKSCTTSEVVAYINGFVDSRDYFGMRWSYAEYFKHTTFSAVSDQTVKVESPDPIADILDIFSEFWPSQTDIAGKPVLGTGQCRVTEFERADGIGHAILEVVDQAASTPQRIIPIRLIFRPVRIDVALNLKEPITSTS